MWLVDKELLERLARDKTFTGRPEQYDGSGECSDPDCEDKLCYFIGSRCQMVSEISYTITHDSCLPSKSCAAAGASLAKEKPLLAAYLVNHQQIIAEVGGLDEEYVHCAMMAELALKRALLDCIKKKAE